jgi:hypothetical protein
MISNLYLILWILAAEKKHEIHRGKQLRLPLWKIIYNSLFASEI